MNSDCNTEIHHGNVENGGCTNAANALYRARLKQLSLDKIIYFK